MASFAPVQPHTCTIMTEPQLFTDAASPACISTLVSLLASGDIYCPETTLRCLARHGHSEACVKDLTNEDLADYVRRTQACFIKSLLAHQWDAPMVKDLIGAIPPASKEALRFLVDIPEKRRAQINPIALFFGQKETSPSDLALFKACLKTKDPELVAAAFNAHPKDRSITDVIGVSILTMTQLSIDSQEESEKDIALATKLYECLSEIVHDTSRKLLKSCLDEGCRIARQFREEAGAKLAFAVSKKEVVEADPALYTHIRALCESTDHFVTWKSIPEELIKEYALSIACVLSRVAVPFIESREIEKSSILACSKELYVHIHAIEDEETREIVSSALLLPEIKEKQNVEEFQ